MPSIQEEVYRRLRADLSGGRWKGGERLSEPKLAAELGVSRNPVREALLKLSAEGLLEREPGLGCRVPRWDVESLSGMYQVREALEGMAARLAAGRASAVELIRLEHEHAVLEQLSEVDWIGEANESDNRFHRQIVQMSGSRAVSRAWDQNRILVISPRQFLREIGGENDPIRQGTLEGLPKQRDRVLQEHGRILTAVKNADADEAEAAARAHVVAAMAHFVELANLCYQGVVDAETSTGLV